MAMHATPPLDPGAPLVADTRTLGRSPGSTQELTREAPVTEEIGLTLIGVPAQSMLRLQLTLTAVTEGVLVTGEVAASVRGECSRCLRPIEDTLAVDVQELYAYEDSTTDDTTDEDEVMRLRGDLVDLQPTVRDALVLAMPSNPLCRPDCPGMCSVCGVPWDELPDDHGHELADPRWAKLNELLDPNRTE